MKRELLVGLVAGAAGTCALNVTTYADMAIRGRGSSSIPAQAAGQLAGDVDLPLGTGETADNRKEGLGALLGYLTGLSTGVAYAVARTVVPRYPLAVAGPAVGLAAMVGSDVPMTATGLTDPRTWGLTGWLSDLVPHLAYGVVTAAVYDTLS